MNHKLNVLVLDDETRITEELKEYLERKKFTVYTANHPQRAFEILQDKTIDIMILDIRLPEMSGLQILEKVKQLFPDIEVIMITGHGDMNVVIEAMRKGAIDFLNKPFHHLDVKIAIERTSKFVFMNRKLVTVNNKNSLLSKELEDRIDHAFIGESKTIQEVYQLAINTAKYDDVNVVITGESGTGKEIIARIIHHASNRKENGFYPVNCSAIPEQLMESEFFGHKKGSFTGAFQDKKGLFELTDKGTLFLDEIADMPIALQAKLLRVLEDQKVKKIGDSVEKKVDIRVVAATNRNIQDLISSNQFRLDLYHRLNTITINLPPLRERKADIKSLTHHFADNFARKINSATPKITPSAIELLKQYDFPGNIRELKNLVERAMIVCKNNTLDENSFPIEPCHKKADMILRMKDFNLERNEQIVILEALKNAQFNQTKASALLGISRHSLIRRMKKFGIGNRT